MGHFVCVPCWQSLSGSIRTLFVVLDDAGEAPYSQLVEGVNALVRLDRRVQKQPAFVEGLGDFLEQHSQQMPGVIGKVVLLADYEEWLQHEGLAFSQL